MELQYINNNNKDDNLEKLVQRMAGYASKLKNNLCSNILVEVLKNENNIPQNK